MFRKVTVSSAENDHGVQVSSPGWRQLKYVRDGREVLIHYDLCEESPGRHYALAFVDRSLRWSDNEPVSLEDRHRIATELVEGCKAFNKKVVIDADTNAYS